MFAGGLDYSGSEYCFLILQAADAKLRDFVAFVPLLPGFSALVALYVLDPNVAFSGMSHNCLPCFPCCGRRRSLWLVRFAGAWLFLFAFLGCAKANLKQFTAPKIVRGSEDPLDSFSTGTIFGVCGLLALPQSPDPGGWPHQVSAPMGACRGVGFLLLRVVYYGNFAVATPEMARGGPSLGELSGGN